MGSTDGRIVAEGQPRQNVNEILLQKSSQMWQCTPVILAIQVGGSLSEAGLVKKCKILSDKQLK
jgi:tartrate dehydratase alpha subunit/fumarate hydratase class I-like protein